MAKSQAHITKYEYRSEQLTLTCDSGTSLYFIVIFGISGLYHELYVSLKCHSPTNKNWGQGADLSPPGSGTARDVHIHLAC